MFVLTIRETGSSWAGRSPIVTVCEDEPKAEEALLEYVDSNWEAECGELSRPEDDDDRIQLYFEHARESYQIIEA